MRFREIAPKPVPANVTPVLQPPKQPIAQQQVFQVQPTQTKYGQMIKQLSVKMAQNNAKMKPTSDDMAIAFARTSQVQRAADQNLAASLEQQNRRGRK